MIGIESEELEKGKEYWLDICFDESGVFSHQTDEAVFFNPNNDCTEYRINKDGFVEFPKPGEGLWYPK